jgi:hypothetical protein
MKTLRYFLIGIVWLPILALMAWWAGFMPFPTRPEEIGLSSFSASGTVGQDGYSIGPGYQRLITAAKAKQEVKSLRYGLGQWDCDPGNKLNCNLYQVRETPFFGVGSPHWVLTVQTLEHGETPLDLYGTYAACKWTEERKSKEADDNRVSYERWATEHNQKIEKQEYESHSCVRMPT